MAPVSDPTREAWAAAYTARAQAYWTEERTRNLVGSKNLPLPPGRAPLLLRAMGLLNEDGSLPASRMRKYRQINHMILVLQPALTELCERHPEVRILDAGCGRSYLTMLLAWWFAEHQKHPARILGVDRSGAMVAECIRRSELAQLRGLEFRAGELADLTLEQPPHGVIALHACDTATDDAIVHGVTAGADLIAVAPCCQAELARAWQARPGGPFDPLHEVPHFRRTAAATTTDAMRVLLLRSRGYDADAMEFVDSSHTAKNTLIRAFRRSEPAAGPLAQYDELVRATGGAGLALADRLP